MELKRWISFLATNASRMEAKLGYISSAPEREDLGVYVQNANFVMSSTVGLFWASAGGLVRLLWGSRRVLLCRSCLP